MNISNDLQRQMMALSPAQRRAILMIVIGEVNGIPITRLLKTPYSCPCCGYVAGHSGESRESRQQALAEHEANSCAYPGQRWQFAANASTYYQRWKPSSDFADCLSQAWTEVVCAALNEATRVLQIGTPEAAWELRRQIEQGQKDSDKRSAATALLDRADFKIAKQMNDTLRRWLEELRADDEPEDEEWEEEWAMENEQ
jgi:hypothetical protein